MKWLIIVIIMAIIIIVVMIKGHIRTLKALIGRRIYCNYRKDHNFCLKDLEMIKVPPPPARVRNPARLEGGGSGNKARSADPIVWVETATLDECECNKLQTGR